MCLIWMNNEKISEKEIIVIKNRKQFGDVFVDVWFKIK
ncbi:hypothetical Protein psc1_04150 [Candidatus Phytoplasma solani]